MARTTLLFLLALLTGLPDAVARMPEDPDLPLGPTPGQCSSFRVPGGTFIARKHAVAVGDADFKDGMGREKRLADFKGKPLLVNFWATYCAPCAVEMPSLDRLQALYDKNDFPVIALNRDVSGMKVAQYYQRRGLKNLRIYTDWIGKVAWHNKVQALPATLLIDADGNEVGRALGLLEWESPEILGLLDACLGVGEPSGGS